MKGRRELGEKGKGVVSYKERYRSTVVEAQRIIVHRSRRLLKTMTLFTPGMGCHSWATREQLTFLRLYIPELLAAKAGTGLNALYLRVTQRFLKQWDPEVVGTIPQSPEFIHKQTVARLNSVRVFFNAL